jgi:hypothetical protein
VEEALKKYLDDKRWARLFEYGEQQAKALGIRESDVERLVAESRAEKRGR